jgi:hypothetical protein
MNDQDQLFEIYEVLISGRTEMARIMLAQYLGLEQPEAA